MIINMAADRAVYIDQSQSLNIHIAEPNYAKLTSMHFHAWKKVNLIPRLIRQYYVCALQVCVCFALIFVYRV